MRARTDPTPVRRAAHPGWAYARGVRRRLRRTLLALAGLVLLALALLLLSFRAAPLAMPPPWTDPLPPASPPQGMQLLQLPTGLTHRSAAFAYRGGSFTDRRDFVMNAALVRHPQGDLLIDVGFSRDIDAHFGLMPLYFRLTTSYTRLTAAADQLDAAGYPRARLRGIVLTHAHWDHVSGVADFPGVPVLVPAEERRFIAEGGALTAVARSLADARYETYAFEGPPYLGFPASHDVYGDGAVVIVPAPGHTPGSVIVFVALPDGRRYAFVGDLVWQREGVLGRAERAFVPRTLADHDPAQVREALLRVAAIVAGHPEVTLVPAHDARGFADLPRP